MYSSTSKVLVLVAGTARHTKTNQTTTLKPGSRDNQIRGKRKVAHHTKTRKEGREICLSHQRSEMRKKRGKLTHHTKTKQERREISHHTKTNQIREKGKVRPTVP